MLQNLLKVFNGYWRMDFPDWGLIHVGDLSSRRIIQQLKFLPSSSYLFVSSSKNSTSFFQTKLASQHDGGYILAFFLEGDTFMIWWIIFDQEVGFSVYQQSQLICFNLKPPSWQYLSVVKRNICVYSFFPLDSKNRHFARLQRLLFFGGDFWECRVSSFFEKENISKVWNWWMGARAGSLNQLTSP